MMEPVRVSLVFLILLILLMLLMLLTPTASGADDLVVTLKNGRIRGSYVTAKGTDKKVRQFLGIPFARPPVGPLRLAAPQEAEPWVGERDGTQQPPTCIQIPEQYTSTAWVTYKHPAMSEDCLYLNVYTPATAASNDRLPVLVWIHGGGLVKGSATQVDGTPLAAYENLVVISIQYRVSLLGFLSTQDEHARGNWGFLDQLAALQWVQGNVAAFGGDPGSVTVAGESAGGISGSLLTLSPLAAGLFHRIIMQSGVAVFTMFLTELPVPSVQYYAEQLDCTNSSSKDLISCIRGKSVDELLAAMTKIHKHMGAVVDGHFLLDTPKELMRRKEVLKVQVMLGMNDHEHGWLIPQTALNFGWYNDMTKEKVLKFMKGYRHHGDPMVNVLIATKYLMNAETPEEIREGFCNMMGDLVMGLPVMAAAGFYLDAGLPVYLYEFIYVSDIQRINRPSFVRADHADDVPYMFGGCFWNGHLQILGNVTKEDERFCRTMMSYWANFVRNGSPNGAGLASWPRYEHKKQQYMELGSEPSVKRGLKKEAFYFNTVTLPRILQQLAEPGSGGYRPSAPLLTVASPLLAWMLVSHS